MATDSLIAYRHSSLADHPAQVWPRLPTAWDAHRRLREPPRTRDGETAAARDKCFNATHSVPEHSTPPSGPRIKMENQDQVRLAASSWETTAQTNEWLVQQRSLNVGTPSFQDHASMPVPEHKRSFSHAFDAGLVVASKRPRQEQSRAQLHPDPAALTGNAPTLVSSQRAEAPLPHFRRTSLLVDSAQLPRQLSPILLRKREPTTRIPEPVHTYTPCAEEGCTRCADSLNTIQDILVTLPKLEASLANGSWAEAVAKCRRDGVSHEGVPRMAELHRLLDLLQEANAMARQLIHGATSISISTETRLMTDRNPSRTGAPLESMKRRSLVGPDDILKPRVASPVSSRIGHESPASDREATSDDFAWRSASVTDALPSIRSSTAHLPHESYGVRLPPMNPPRIPLHSEHSSPLQTASPTSVAYAPSSISTTAATSMLPHVSRQMHPPSPTLTSPSTYPPIRLSPAIAEHSAALQHELSVKAYALSTLQAEHEKLLGALSRSKTRAKTLELKAINSDAELNNLSEEKLQLIARIGELEIEVEQTKQRGNEFREAAVKEGKQWVEIIRMASRIERVGSSAAAKATDSIAGELVNESIKTSRDNGNGAEAEPTTHAVASTQMHQLRAEIEGHRKRASLLESALLQIRDERRRAQEAVRLVDESQVKISSILDEAIGEQRA